MCVFNIYGAGFISINTPFFDGNKRTGFITADVILRSHGYEIQTNEKDIIDFLLQVASYRVDVKGVEEW